MTRRISPQTLRCLLAGCLLLTAVDHARADTPARPPASAKAASRATPRTAESLPPLEPKPAPQLPPKVQEIANLLFNEASAAANAGNYDVAIKKYRELQGLASHAHISFNIALALEAQGDYVAAIKQLQAYLPTAPRDEAITIAARIAQLSAAPAPITAVATTNFKVKSLWFIDGELKGRDACKFEVAPGRHKIENVSEIGYWSDRLRTAPGPKSGKRLERNVDVRIDGNLIISAPANENWGWRFAIDGSDRDDAFGKGVHHSGRYTVAVGTHRLTAFDTVCQYQVEFTVAKDQLVYFHLLREGYDPNAVLKDMGPDKPACGRIVGRPIVIDFDAKVPGRLQTPDAKK
ncbi:MAG: tetratricopeptide repeat protein [Kofleriaceae bacterium]|nr:tetratricopeptide repeat protein [Kofleriaceae bacterium]